MFFHDDLKFYKNQNFRSFEYVSRLWEIIQFDLLFISGVTNNGNITITLESDLIQIVATSNFKTILNKTYKINFIHSLNLCYDFVTDITINIINTTKSFYFEVINCKYYYDKTVNADEGFIECILSSNLQVSNIVEFKLKFFITLVKELQFVINKNVFLLDIEKKDLIVSDIDSHFELITCISKLEDISFESALKKSSILSEDINLIRQLKNQIDKT